MWAWLLKNQDNLLNFVLHCEAREGQVNHASTTGYNVFAGNLNHSDLAQIWPVHHPLAFFFPAHICSRRPHDLNA